MNKELSAEIIAIGDELISGDVVDTNSSYLSKQLHNMGISCKYHSNIGDDKNDIKVILNQAVSRSDFIVFTGGLGPTDDDITVSAISEALDQKLVYKEEVWLKIEDTIKKSGRNVDIYNKSQAFVPEKAAYFLNEAGTAPAVHLQVKNKNIFLLPGVPSEVIYFWENHIRPVATQLSNTNTKVRKLLFAGIAEAKINEELGELALSKNPKVAFLPQSSEIIVKLTAKAQYEQEAIKLLDELEQKIQEKIGKYFWGYGEKRVESIIQELMTRKDLRLSLAESCTGGLISKLLTDISGASAYIDMNLVTYSNDAKIQLLGVNSETLDSFGAVSEQTAEEMAQGVKSLARSDIGIGITGVAGPTGGTKKSPVGLVCVGFSFKNKNVVHKLSFPEKLPREEIRQRAAKKTLHILKDILLSEFT